MNAAITTAVPMFAMISSNSRSTAKKIRLSCPALAGGPLIILSGTAVMFGGADAGGTLQGIATIPEGLWELSLGITAR
jgi:hypothetical protein